MTEHIVISKTIKVSRMVLLDWIRNIRTLVNAQYTNEEIMQVLETRRDLRIFSKDPRC